MWMGNWGLLHGGQLLFQLSDELPQVLPPLLLGGHHIGGGLVQKAGVGELGVQALELPLLLAQLLGQPGLFLLQVHQLGQGHGDAGGVGDNGDAALGLLSPVAVQPGHPGDRHVAGVSQAL